MNVCDAARPTTLISSAATNATTTACPAALRIRFTVLHHRLNHNSTEPHTNQTQEEGQGTSRFIIFPLRALRVLRGEMSPCLAGNLCSDRWFWDFSLFAGNDISFRCIQDLPAYWQHESVVIQVKVRPHLLAV